MAHLAEVTYSVTGKGANGVSVGGMCIFTVRIKVDGDTPSDPIKEDLAVYCDAPESPDYRFNIMGGSSGSYIIGFKPSVPGQHWMDFSFRGKFATEPYLLPIDKLKKVPEHPYTGKERYIFRFSLGSSLVDK